MLRSNPKLRYCGLTIVMSNPSRMDKLYLLSGNGGTMFGEICYPDFNQMQCDVRVMEDQSPLLPGTKCIMLLGEAAMHRWCPDSKDNTLNELRGSVLYYQSIPCIPSFLPQDAVDIKNYESTLNELAQDYSEDDTVSDDDEDEGDVKTFSATKRSNYFFWLKRDVWKVKHILKVGVPPYLVSPRYYIFPSSAQVISILLSHKNEYLYFDMETDFEEQNLLCFAFSFDGISILCVPVLDYRYAFAYPDYYNIMSALAIAVRDNIVVAHNGSGFDFLVLAYKYRIAVRRCYDTMLAHHRCFPSVEKSLGHCTSYWTWEKFHKDTDSQAYYTYEQMRTKLQYCGKDVYTMALIHKEIETYAKTVPGLPESIAAANQSIVPYLYETLKGIRYDELARRAIVDENDRLMNQYIGMSKLLLGEDCYEDILSRVRKTKTSFLGSDKQQCIYFHELLGYQVIYRSEKTGDPSLGKKIMYKLALQYPDNALIPLILAYRKVKKETGALKFMPWIGDDGKVFKPIQEKII